MEGLDEARGQMDVGVPVARPRLEHADGGVQVLAQPVGEHASRRTGANDHVVERFHRSFKAFWFDVSSSREARSNFTRRRSLFCLRMIFSENRFHFFGSCSRIAASR